MTTATKGRGKAPDIDEDEPDVIEPVTVPQSADLDLLIGMEDVLGDELTPAGTQVLTEAIDRAKRGVDYDTGELRGPLTLVDKVVAAMSAIEAIEKGGRNQAQGYDYRRAVDVTRSVRREFFARGVLLVTSVEDIQTTVIPRDNKAPNIMAEVRGTFTLMDGVDSPITFSGVGVGIDAGDKGVYKAITGMLKYGLVTLGLIPDEKDDPEASEPEVSAPVGITITSSAIPGVMQGGRQTGATQAQVTAIRNKAKDLSMLPSQLNSLVISTLGLEISADDIDDTAESGRRVMERIGNLSFEDAGKIIQMLDMAKA